MYLHPQVRALLPVGVMSPLIALAACSLIAEDTLRHSANAHLLKFSVMHEQAGCYQNDLAIAALEQQCW
jgi:hypothetical protein